LITGTLNPNPEAIPVNGHVRQIVLNLTTASSAYLDIINFGSGAGADDLGDYGDDGGDDDDLSDDAKLHLPFVCEIDIASQVQPQVANQQVFSGNLSSFSPGTVNAATNLGNAPMGGALVCKDYFGSNSAGVGCRQSGYDTSLSVSGSVRQQFGFSVPRTSVGQSCSGDEQYMEDCTFNWGGGVTYSVSVCTDPSIVFTQCALNNMVVGQFGSSSGGGAGDVATTTSNNQLSSSANTAVIVVVVVVGAFIVLLAGVYIFKAYRSIRREPMSKRAVLPSPDKGEVSPSVRMENTIPMKTEAV